MSKTSSNTSEIRGNLTFEVPFDDSMDVSLYYIFDRFDGFLFRVLGTEIVVARDRSSDANGVSQRSFCRSLK